jgi:hypothetical protein
LTTRLYPESEYRGPFPPGSIVDIRLRALACNLVLALGRHSTDEAPALLLSEVGFVLRHAVLVALRDAPDLLRVAQAARLQ